MRSVSMLFVAAFCGVLFLFSAGTANAQSYSYSSSSVSIGSHGFSFHFEDRNVGIHIQNGRFGNQVGVHINNRRWRQHPNHRIHRRHHRVYQQPQVIVVQPRIPQAIQITVIERRQVQEQIYYRDPWGNLCPTGDYTLVWRDVQVVKTAHWDRQYGSYVYYDSRGNLHTVRR